MCLQDTDATPVTKSHNSCKTCSIAKSYSYGHLHVMLVTVYGYEHNSSRAVGGVVHTIFQVVYTDGRTYIRTKQVPYKSQT